MGGKAWGLEHLFSPKLVQGLFLYTVQRWNVRSGKVCEPNAWQRGKGKGQGKEMARAALSLAGEGRCRLSEV